MAEREYAERKPQRGCTVYARDLSAMWSVLLARKATGVVFSHPRRLFSNAGTRCAALALGVLVGVIGLLTAACGDEAQMASGSTAPAQPAASTGTSTATISWSTEAREMAQLYRELLDFKDDPEFHAYCYGVGHPYNEWMQKTQSLSDRGSIELLSEIGIIPGDLWDIGKDYCDNEGQKTEFVIIMENRMNAGWVDLVTSSNPSVNSGTEATPVPAFSIGQYYKGRILHVSIAAITRTDELRWTTSTRVSRQSVANEEFFRIVPQSAENEFVLLRVQVENHAATIAIVDIDQEAAKLRDFLQGRYFPIDVSERVEEAGVPESASDRCNLPVNPDDPTTCVKFLWNAVYAEVQPNGETKFVERPQKLPKGTGLDGWIVFEVPKNAQLSSFHWFAGDTIKIDF